MSLGSLTSISPRWTNTHSADGRMWLTGLFTVWADESWQEINWSVTHQLLLLSEVTKSIDIYYYSLVVKWKQKICEKLRLLPLSASYILICFNQILNDLFSYHPNQIKWKTNAFPSTKCSILTCRFSLFLVFRVLAIGRLLDAGRAQSAFHGC